MTPFFAYMSKCTSILWVRIAKCVIAKSDCLPIFTIERTEAHIKPGIYVWIVPAWFKNKKWKRHIWGCKILGTLYFKNALVDFFKSCQGKGNGLTIITLEDFNRLLLDFETEFPCHRYSVAKEAAMSTKHALKLSSMLDKYVVISFFLSKPRLVSMICYCYLCLWVFEILPQKQVQNFEFWIREKGHIVSQKSTSAIGFLFRLFIKLTLGFKMNSVLRLIFFFGDILERSGQVIDSFLLPALSKLRQERMGSLNNGDGDVSEKGKKAIGLDWQNNNSARLRRKNA